MKHHTVMCRTFPGSNECRVHLLSVHRCLIFGKCYQRVQLHTFRTCLGINLVAVNIPQALYGHLNGEGLCTCARLRIRHCCTTYSVLSMMKRFYAGLEFRVLVEEAHVTEQVNSRESVDRKLSFGPLSSKNERLANNR